MRFLAFSTFVRSLSPRQAERMERDAAPVGALARVGFWPFGAFVFERM
jgi:hypothetical protein